MKTQNTTSSVAQLAQQHGSKHITRLECSSTRPTTTTTITTIATSTITAITTTTATTITTNNVQKKKKIRELPSPLSNDC